jgi:hypothetical protein
VDALVDASARVRPDESTPVPEPVGPYKRSLMLEEPEDVDEDALPPMLD